jgi:hypothetical protein
MVRHFLQGDLRPIVMKERSAMRNSRGEFSNLSGYGC